jgi:hypothetical protein
MKRYLRRDTVSMKRGLRASSSSAVRSSLIAVLNRSVTNWWPQTSSTGVGAGTPVAVRVRTARRMASGASATAVPSRNNRASPVELNRSKRTVRFEPSEECVIRVFSHFDTNDTILR